LLFLRIIGSSPLPASSRQGNIAKIWEIATPNFAVFLQQLRNVERIYMRLIGHLQNESSAKTLADYLVSLDIRNLVEPDAEGWAVWVYSEDQIEAGRQALSSFLNNPDDGKFRNARQSAAAVEERHRREKAKFDERVRTPDRIWASSAIGPVTLTLIVASVAVTLLAYLSPGLTYWLYLSLPEVRRGEIWRLITPIFIHFNLMHIVFNMWVLRDFGTLVERRRGSMVLVLLVAFIGIGSNLGQYFYGGPMFGGMSGVLYGLLGYIWLRGQCDPSSGLHLDPTSLAMMLIWFFLCLMDIIPGAANACHAAGLVMGMIIGAAPLAKRMF
jgi:GlpG protein